MESIVAQAEDAQKYYACNPIYFMKHKQKGLLTFILILFGILNGIVDATRNDNDDEWFKTYGMQGVERFL